MARRFAVSKSGSRFRNAAVALAAGALIAVGGVVPGAAADIVPLSVGVPEQEPGENQAKIIIRAGGDRTGTGSESQTVSPLAGVTYEIYRTENLALSGGDLVGECTTDTTGQCGAFVDFGGGDGSRNFYAVAVSAPDGWTAPTSWTNAATAQNFRFGTGLISTTGDSASRTVTLPLRFNDTVTEPTWANIRDNNPLPTRCDVDVALVVDLSNSLTEWETEFGTTRPPQQRSSTSSRERTRGFRCRRSRPTHQPTG